MLLPLLLNSTTQEKALLDGLDYISNLVVRYSVIEDIHCHQESVYSTSGKSMRDLYNSLEAQVVKLYAQILGYQAQAVCQLFRSKGFHYGRDISKADDWASLLSDIKVIEQGCKDFSQVVDSTRLQAAYREQASRMDELLALHKDSYEKLQQTTDGLVSDIRHDRAEQKDWRQNEKDSECMRALRTSQYEDHKARNPNRVHDTCQWFLKNEKYSKWNNRESNGLLWVTADPGCGKSVLAKYLVDEELRNTASRTTCYFFFKDDNNEQNNVRNAVCALLHQLLSQKPDLITKVLRAFDKNGAKYFLSFHNCWALLLEVGQNATSDVVCILDALDECEENGKQTLIDSLNTLFSSRQNQNERMRLLVTSRPYNDIEQRFDSGVTVRLTGEDETQSIQREIDLVIRDEVPRLATSLKLNSRTQSVLQSRLLRTPHRTYLWLHLVLDEARKSLGITTPKRIEKLLDTMPTTVFDAYEKMLSRSPHPEQARKLLHIVVAAMRLLTLKEMNMAPNIEQGNICRDDVDLDPEETFKSRVKNLCGLFLSVVDSRVYLLHQTVKEFLVCEDTAEINTNTISSDNGRWKKSIQINESNRVLAEICLIYLSFDVFEEEPLIAVDSEDDTSEESSEDDTSKESSEDDTSEERREDNSSLVRETVNENRPAEVLADRKESRGNEDQKDEGHAEPKDGLWMHKLPEDSELQPYTEKNELLDDAALYWPYHFRHSKEVCTLSTAWHYICNNKSSRVLTWYGVFVSNIYDTWPDRIDPLIFACYFGHDTIITELLERKPDLEVEDTLHGRTPLSWAAEMGGENLIRLLLDAGSSVEARTSGPMWTPLHYAAHRGNEMTLRALLVGGASVDSRSSDEKTPLSLAAPEGYESIVNFLIEQGAYIDSQDEERWTPLYIAAMCGKEKVVRALLVRGAFVDSKDRSGTTPLSLTAYYGHESIVNLLIEQGAYIDSQDEDGWTPLSRATNEGVEVMVRVLLQRGASTSIKDGMGRTALDLARERPFPSKLDEYTAVIELLTSATSAT